MQQESTVPGERTIAILQELILLNLNAAEEYSVAGSHGDDSAVKQLSRSLARARSRAVHDLQALVAAAGEEPVRTGSIGDSVRRWCTELRAIIGNGSEESMILAEALRDWDAAIRKYETFIPEVAEQRVRSVLLQQLEELRAFLKDISLAAAQYRACPSG